jgi:hypothetical protein
MYMSMLVTSHNVHTGSTSSWGIICFPISISKIAIVSSGIGVAGVFLSTANVLSNSIVADGQVRKHDCQ